MLSYSALPILWFCWRTPAWPIFQDTQNRLCTPLLDIFFYLPAGELLTLPHNYATFYTLWPVRLLPDEYSSYVSYSQSNLASLCIRWTDNTCPMISSAWVISNFIFFNRLHCVSFKWTNKVYLSSLAVRYRYWDSYKYRKEVKNVLHTAFEIDMLAVRTEVILQSHSVCHLNLTIC